MEDDPRVTCMDILDPRAQVCPGVGLLHVHILVPSTFDWSFSDDTCACVCIVAGAGDQGIANVATAFRRAGRLFMLCWVAVFSRLFMLLDFVCIHLTVARGHLGEEETIRGNSTSGKDISPRAVRLHMIR